MTIRTGPFEYLVLGLVITPIDMIEKLIVLGGRMESYCANFDFLCSKYHSLSDIYTTIHMLYANLER